MSSFREIRLATRPDDALLNVIGPGRVNRFLAAGDALADCSLGRTVWNVSLDESATGVGELVRSRVQALSDLGAPAALVRGYIPRFDVA